VGEIVGGEEIGVCGGDWSVGVPAKEIVGRGGDCR
jgi:hypothetical protein